MELAIYTQLYPVTLPICRGSGGPRMKRKSTKMFSVYDLIQSRKKNVMLTYLGFY